MERFSIATFNLFNLNEPGIPIYTDKDGWAQAEYDLKIEWTTRQINLLGASIFAFQELWHEDSLKKAFSKSIYSGKYNLLIPENTTGKGIVCAAAVHTDIKILRAEWIDRFPEELVLRSRGDDPQTPEISVDIKGFSRPVLHATLQLHDEELPVHLYVCHFKSKGPTQVYRESWYKKEVHAVHSTAMGAAISTIRRTAEAAAMRVILNLTTKGTNEPVIVVGDLNDGQNSNTQNILTEQPNYLFGDTSGGSDVSLYSAQIMQEFRDTRDVLYSYSYKGMKESLDHVLFSQEFYDHSKQRRWAFAGLTVNNDHLNEGNHKVSGTNDHGIIKANFVYRPVRKL
ncbi:endonuclease/exonuclease/phosphatase family protein [Pseudomonas chengduensis]